jgi:hypothetical protein
MSGGHYTAFVKCSENEMETFTRQGIQSFLNVGSASIEEMEQGLDGVLRCTECDPLDKERYTQYTSCSAACQNSTWYHFDDDSVRPLHPLELQNAIVTGICYSYVYYSANLYI